MKDGVSTATVYWLVLFAANNRSLRFLALLRTSSFPTGATTGYQLDVSENTRSGRLPMIDDFSGCLFWLGKDIAGSCSRNHA